ncbi:MAG: radical SAM family heme chaperone HemW [Endomicrobium sp.]|jgi:oxygen-independent coproporphyrinogen-3 oxidase|nr:radical SAM family heme chaperone HemW [Endomicrobium sp.]
MLTSVYLHIPFCYNKCFYCSFFSVKYNKFIVDEYVNALIKEMSLFKNQSIYSFYIGGGTPSILSTVQLQSLLKNINNVLYLNKPKEFTIELNPDSTSLDKLKILKDSGVNRLSLGLQTVHDRELKYLGRTYTFQTFINIYKLARKVGFSNINIDLIYGFPYHTTNSWRKTLDIVLTLSSEHLSIYPMMLEKNTFFYKKNLNINDNVQRNMYKYTVTKLSNYQYEHYEISNWAKKNKESLHNIHYWRNNEYIGIGAGASGYLNHTRYKNIDNILKYIDLIQRNINPKAEVEKINKLTNRVESIILGLRLLKEGVPIKYFTEYRKHYIALKKCLLNNLLINHNGNIMLNQKYVFVCNQILLQFI